MVFQLFHLLGIDTDPDRPDPGKLCGFDPIRIRIHNTNLSTIVSRATVPVAGDKPDDQTPHPQCKHISGLDNFKKCQSKSESYVGFFCVGEGLRYLGFGRRPTFSGASSIGTNVLCTILMNLIKLLFQLLVVSCMILVIKKRTVSIIVQPTWIFMCKQYRNAFN